MNAIIVDDEEVAAAAMKRRIKWDKYGITDVWSAASMRQAIRIMEQEHMDLMLCDVEMPGGSGLELYEWVRTYSPDTECIFVSCHPEYEYVRKALIMGSMDYVLKPVDYEEMDNILSQAALRLNSRHSDIAQKAVSKSDLKSEDSDGFPAYASDSVNDAVRYINNNLSSNMSISDIADVAHLNPQYFMRLFKKETGKPILEFITDCRLNKARRMLIETNIPITEIALEIGYDNFSYFSKLFKKYEGKSPTEYRKQK